MRNDFHLGVVWKSSGVGGHFEHGDEGRAGPEQVESRNSQLQALGHSQDDGKGRLNYSECSQGGCWLGLSSWDLPTGEVLLQENRSTPQADKE